MELCFGYLFSKRFLISGYNICHQYHSWKLSFSVAFVWFPSVIQQCWSEGGCGGVQVSWMLCDGTCVPLVAAEQKSPKVWVSAEPALATTGQGQQK